MPKQFPIELYLEANKPRLPDVAYISQALGNIATGIKQRQFEERKRQSSAIEKLIGAGYTFVKRDVDESGQLTENPVDLVEMLDITKGSLTKIPKGISLKSPTKTYYDFVDGKLVMAGETSKSSGLLPKQPQDIEYLAKDNTTGKTYDEKGDIVSPNDKKYEGKKIQFLNYTPIETKEITSMVAGLPKLDQAFQAAKQLKELFYRAVVPDVVETGDVLGGVKSRLKGAGRWTTAQIGANPLTKIYLSNRAGFSGLIAKGGFGEAGMLTNADIQRVVSLLPGTGSTASEAETAWIQIETILGSARTRYEKKIAERGGIPTQVSPTSIKSRYSNLGLE